MRHLMWLVALACLGAAAHACDAIGDPDIDRVIAIALGTEYGGAAPLVAKWGGEVRIAILGKPGQEDEKTLRGVVAELGKLIAPTPIRIVTSSANVRVHFAPEAEFESILPEYEPENMGYFWMWWNAGRTIYKSEVLISTTGLTQKERNHIIREEVTQMLGLAKDVYDDERSIFYLPWTSTTAYTDSDREVIHALYCPQIKPGMDEDKVRAVLEGH